MNKRWGSISRRDRIVRRELVVIGLVVGLLATAALSFGDDYHTVVRIGQCSGVCVDPRGLIFTAKHCEHGPVETVMFPGRTVSAHRIYVAGEVEGPVVFDCEGDGFPYQPIAQQPPSIGSVVSSSGYPLINGQRLFQRKTGTMLRGASFKFKDKPFIGNITDMPLIPGWSGGPLLDERGDVCGLLSASDEKESVFITLDAVQRAYNAVKSGNPTLYIFTTRNCSSCLRFKSDYETDRGFRGQLQSAFRIEFVDADLRPDLAKQHEVVEVPTFIVPGQARVQGYPGKQSLADRLLLHNGEWVPVSEIDWSHVSIVILAAEQDVGRIRGAVRGRLLDAAIGPIQRRVTDATEGKANLTIVAQRNEPERFAMIAQAARVHVDRFFVLVLVREQDLGLKGMILGVVEKAIGSQLGEVPINLIFERVHPEDFERVVSVLTGIPYNGPQIGPGGEPREDGFPFQETAFGGILAVLTERLKLVRKFQAWREGRKQK